jgi:hypothetical protein
VAGLLALVLVIVLDAVVVSAWFPWSALVSRVRPEQSVYWGVTRDRAELARVAAREDAIRVGILGSSRGHTGFLREWAEEAMEGVAFAQLSHALQDPATVHALVPDLIDAGIDVAVLTMSHVDTHRPVRLEPLPAKSTARLSTLMPLVEVGGFAWLFEHREAAYRIATAQLSNLYRFRDNLGRAGANGLREFALDARLEGKRRVQLLGTPVLGEAGPARLAAKRERALLSRVLPHQQRWPLQLAWFKEVRDGPQVTAQMAWLERSIDDLVAAGVRVVIAECPVHGIGKRVSQPGTEEAFRAFAAEQARRKGVFGLPLDDAVPYTMADYLDLFHLNERGAARFTREIVGLLEREVLPAFETQSRRVR